MKKRGLFNLCTLMIAMSFASCSDEFLNTQPLDKISSDATWADGALSEAFIFNVYASLGKGGFEEQGLAAITDEAMFTHSGRNIDPFMEGTETPSNVAWISETYGWDNMFSAIRKANIALEQLPTATFDDAERKERLLGEAHFLRAYYYHQLLRYYGGAPIIDRSFNLGEDLTVARGTFEENVNFIVSDLDQAAALLQGKESTPGRASQIAALALKSRVLLYAASDLRDGPTASAKSSVLGSYSNLELVAYTSGDRTARWNAAKNAAQAVLDLASGYKLNLSAPVSAEEGKANYLSIAMGGGSAVGDAAASVELLFQRTHTALFVPDTQWPLGGVHNGINNGPNGYHNWAGNTPIQELVDDYEMMDGSKFNWNNPAHAADPYADRDPRFYMTILYDGADWKPRPDDVVSFDGVNQIQSGAYDDGKGGTVPGVDTRQGPVEDWNGSRSGYYARKYIDANPAMTDNQSNTQVVPWPFIRYTEVVLNFVEAAIETGDEGAAREWLNKIRFRVGMPAITDSGSALRDRYRNERRVEMAYEEQRYHDARRWMIAPETLGRGIKVISVRATLKPGATAHSPYKHDKAVYNYTYNVVDNTDNETRVWDDKMYYRPITRDEINRNEKLIQNPGY